MLRMMLDVAGGVLIAAFVCGLFALGFAIVAEKTGFEERWGIWCILLAFGLTLWIVIARWPVS
jgi:hypothetical protein